MNILRHLEGTRVITEIGAGEGHVMMEVKVGLMTFFFFFFLLYCVTCRVLLPQLGIEPRPSVV